MDIAYLKSVMTEAGFLRNPSPGVTWSDPEERAWRGVCAKLGLRFTPFPSREKQDLYWLDLIDKKQLVLVAPAQPAAPAFDIRDLLPAPTRLHPDTPVAIARRHSSLLDPELSKETAAKYPHAKKLPRKYLTRSPVRDPLENTSPNTVAAKRRTPKRADPEKAARLNRVLEKESPSRDPDKPIRVR